MLIKKLKRNAIEPFASLLFRRYFKTVKQTGFSVCLSFDCDLPEDIEVLPELLDLLKKYDIKTSFACVGIWIENHPKIHKRIIREGHEIINHTYSHPDNEVLSPTSFFNKLSYSEQVEEIKKCDSVCKTLLNYSPVGFRTPHFGRLHCSSVYAIIKGLGYKYSSSTLLVRTRGIASVNGICEIPMMTCPDHYFPLFDTWHCYRSEAPAHTKFGEFFRLFKSAVTICRKNNVACVFYFDPQDLSRHKTEFEACLSWLKHAKIKPKKCEEISE